MWVRQGQGKELVKMLRGKLRVILSVRIKKDLEEDESCEVGCRRRRLRVRVRKA